MEVRIEDLKQIKGGGWPLATIIGAGIVFLIGIIDGYVRPFKCNS